MIPEAFLARLRGIQANPAVVYTQPEPAPPSPPPTPVVPAIGTWVPARERPDPTIPERPPEFGWMVALDEWARARAEGKLRGLTACLALVDEATAPAPGDSAPP